MTTKQLAAKLIEYRTTTSLIIPGRLMGDVGNDAMKEALDRRWIEADTDSGFLRLSMNQGVIEEIQKVAEAKCADCKCDPCECCGTCHKHPCECPKCEDVRRRFTDGHVHRHLHEYVTPPAYGSGQGERPGTGPVLQPNPDTSRSRDLMVGQDVTVAPPGGKSYAAKVAEKLRDGTYRLSFGAERPTDDKAAYRDTELQLVSPTGRANEPVR
jgi:hypothetical protein